MAEGGPVMPEVGAARIRRQLTTEHPRHRFGPVPIRLVSRRDRELSDGLPETEGLVDRLLAAVPLLRRALQPDVIALAEIVLPPLAIMHRHGGAYGGEVLLRLGAVARIRS